MILRIWEEGGGKRGESTLFILTLEFPFFYIFITQKKDHFSKKKKKKKLPRFAITIIALEE